MDIQTDKLTKLQNVLVFLHLNTHTHSTKAAI